MTDEVEVRLLSKVEAQVEGLCETEIYLRYGRYSIVVPRSEMFWRSDDENFRGGEEAMRRVFVVGKSIEVLIVAVNPVAGFYIGSIKKVKLEPLDELVKAGSSPLPAVVTTWSSGDFGDPSIVRLPNGVLANVSMQTEHLLERGRRNVEVVIHWIGAADGEILVDVLR